MKQLTVEDLVPTAMTLLGRDGGPVTSESLVEVAERVVLMAPHVTVEEVVRELELLVTIRVRPAVMLSMGHTPWLASQAASVEWKFWDRYRDWLLSVRSLPESVVRETDDITDRILDLTADPRADQAFDRRGLVVGHVQSGKTGHYIGLAAKAIDAGYKVVIILAGALNDLRSQTQLRVDQGLLGWDTNVSREMASDATEWIGVGLLPGHGRPILRPQTDGSIAGDFKTNKASVKQMLGTDPIVMVIKKNKSVLENVDRWLTALDAQVASDGKRRIPDHAMLMIDDEADHYSVNTNSMSEDDPTTINKLIRQLLDRFEKHAYVGYTATAFANIFIGSDVEHPDYGDDLFPRSFIVSIKAPSNYIGAERVFGLKDIDGREDVDALPIVRHVKDAADWLPHGHKKSHPVGPLPDSLSEAIRAFVLSCAVRRARGQVTAHNSMLVHVTLFNDVQEGVSRRVTEELDALRNEIRYGVGEGSDVRFELKELFDDDFVPTSRDMHGQGLVLEDDLVTWDQVDDELLAAVTSIGVRMVNGRARDALEYYEHRATGLNVIAIGGNKLSRGLTLEGLTVSYYLRASRAYDTLLQMGRWFGYRPRYADVCRLYTTSQLEGWYRDITSANAELLADLDLMAAEGATPADFGLRVRQHPDGLMITNPAKLRRAQSVRVNFSQTLTETVVFDRAAVTRSHNLRVTQELLQDREGPSHDGRTKPTGRIVWSGVPGDLIAAYLDQLRTSERARRARTDLLGKYISEKMREGELVDWTVLLASPNDGDRKTTPIAGQSVGWTERAAAMSRGRTTQQLSTTSQFRIKRLVSPRHERTDLTDGELALAANLHGELAGSDAGDGASEPPYWRRARSATRGLLMVYLLEPVKGDVPPIEDDDLPYVGVAVSLPRSLDHYGGVNYMVNDVMRRLELDDV